MPRLKNRVPSYRLHKGTGQAVVTLNGRDVYLGIYDSVRSRERWLEVARACYVAVAKPPVEADQGEVERQTSLIQSRLEKMSVRDEEGCYALAEYTARTAATSLMGVRFGFIEGGALCIVYANMGSRNQHVLDEFLRQLDWKELATATWPKLIDSERPEDAHHSWAVVINDCDGGYWRDVASGRNPEAE